MVMLISALPGEAVLKQAPGWDHVRSLNMEAAMARARGWSELQQHLGIWAWPSLCVV